MSGTVTSTSPLIGILGGYGRVGTAAARFLTTEYGYRLRIGGRSAEAAWALARRLGGGAEAAVADAVDSQSLTHFSRGCTTLLDCSGTAYALRGRVRRSVLAAGAHYVGMTDDGGPRVPAGPASAVLFTGLSGTLAGWLPRRLADGLFPVTRFTGWYSGAGSLASHAAVTRLLARRRSVVSPTAGAPEGADPRRRTDKACLFRDEAPPITREPRPPWPLPARPAAVHRIVPEELWQQAYDLRLEGPSWHEVFEGPHVPAALERFARAPEAAGEGTALMAAAGELVRASLADTAERSPYQTVHGTLDGLTPDGRAVRRSVSMHCVDVAGLLGTMASVVVHDITRGRVPSGVHTMAATLPPKGTADRIVRHLPQTILRVTEAPIDGPGMMTSAPQAARHPG